jgi:hypothetical protein
VKKHLLAATGQSQRTDCGDWREAARNSFLAAGFAVSALLGLAGGTQAASLVGDSISAEFDSPSLGTSLCTSCFTPNTFTVGSGIETTLAISASQVTFDFSANQLVVNFTVSGLALRNDAFAGPVFTVLSGNPFDPVTSVTGMLASDVTETGGKLALNWTALNYPNGFPVNAQIVVDFQNVVGTTPLPAALPLFAGGLGAMGLIGWRRKRKAAAIAA